MARDSHSAMNGGVRGKRQPNAHTEGSISLLNPKDYNLFKQQVVSPFGARGRSCKIRLSVMVQSECLHGVKGSEALPTSSREEERPAAVLSVIHTHHHSSFSLLLVLIRYKNKIKHAPLSMKS